MGDFHIQPDSEHSPTPWELVEATEHHGPYICNVYGGDVCDLYAMSNPGAFSTRNGGNSYPVPFTNADANAAFIVEAVNSHAALKSRVEELTKALEKIAMGDWGYVSPGYGTDQSRIRNDIGRGNNVPYMGEWAVIARRALAMPLEGRGGAT